MFEYEFMRNAFFAGFLVAVVCGVVGTYVILNRIVSLAGGIAHATYGGMGMAGYFGFPYFVGIMGSGLLGAAIMGWLTWKDRQQADSLIGVLWAAGMALGVIFVDLTPGYGADLMSMLFGSILAIPTQLIGVMTVLAGAILVLVWYKFPEFLALSHDAEFARIRGVPVAQMYMLLVAMVAFAVVMAVQAVGMILVIALLTIPAKIAAAHTRQLSATMGLAAFLGVVMAWGGIVLAWFFDLNAGASIILLGTLLFGLDAVWRRWRQP